MVLFNVVLNISKDRDCITSCLFGCPHGEKAFPYTHSGSLLLQFVRIVSHPLTMHHCEKVGSLLGDLIIGTRRLLLPAHTVISSAG